MCKVTQIYHTWDKWECYKSGFYKSETYLTKEEQELMCKELFCNMKLFEKTLKKVIGEWKYSCEHFLTASGQNVIAWLGQACCAYLYKISNSVSRNGYNMCNEDQKKEADFMAEKYYKIWLEKFKESEQISWV